MPEKYPMEIYAETLRLDSDEAPRPGKQGLTLLHAMRVYCPVEWYAVQEEHLGKRPRAPDARNPMSACDEELLRRLRAGELYATGVRPGEVKASRIEPEAWHAMRPLSESDLVESVARESAPFEPRHRLTVVYAVRVFERRPAVSTVSSEKTCATWFRDHLRATTGNLKYLETLAAAREALSPAELAERAFRRVWDDKMPESRKYGARPRAVPRKASRKASR